MNHITLGKMGEDLAATWLEEHGYAILERNWRSHHIEVDIIAMYHEFLIIVEVKTRAGNAFGEPYTAVDHKKQRALIAAAERYIFSHHIDLEVRFDIISIIIDSENTVLEHIPEAFRAIAR